MGAGMGGTGLCGLFPSGHATHPQWQLACELVLAQLRARMAAPGHAEKPALGLVYVTQAFAAQARQILAHLRGELPHVAAWSGAVAAAICASGAEYWDEPAICVMLCDVPVGQFRLFSGLLPLAGEHAFAPHTALVHADAHMPDLADLLPELAQRTDSAQLWGGLLAHGAGHGVQLAWPAAGPHARAGGQDGVLHDGVLHDGVLRGGLSGVAFSAQVPLHCRLTHGCQPIGRERTVTACDGNVLLALDGQPALACLLGDLMDAADNPPASTQARRLRSAWQALPHGWPAELPDDLPPRLLQEMAQTLVALAAPGQRAVLPTGNLQQGAWVRHLLGIDLVSRGLALNEPPQEGQRLAFARRSVAAARADLMRTCAELSDELVCERLDASGIRGALYIGCAGRGGAYFGQPNAEMEILRHALGDVPLCGFYAQGEIAGQRLHAYSGVLLCWGQPAQH